MATNVLQNHNRNPYAEYKRTQNLVLFTATDDPFRGILLFLHPISLRVMIVLASKLNSEGYATATLEEIAFILHSTPSYVNKGILELARCNLISKKKRSEYWIRPAAFRPAQIEV